MTRDVTDAGETADQAGGNDVPADGQGIADLQQDTADAGRVDWVADLGGIDAAEVDADLFLPPEPGEFGYPCESDDQCKSGFCVMTADGDVCTVYCTEECPPGWHCRLHEGSLPDQVFICAPPSLALCGPCMTDADCHTNRVSFGEACVPYGAAGSFCGTPCQSFADCPDGYECSPPADDPDPGTGSGYCVATAGDCGCPTWFSDRAAWTACFVENEWGKCGGYRYCGDAGLSACDAPEPAAEQCDGQDNDCDGEADEGAGGGQCKIENQHGACAGTFLCLAGLLTCEAQTPEPEACDGQDNSCDGETDEGFPDTDGDGEKDCMETDKDGDGVVDGKDNCPYELNPAQADFDLDGDGDVCDLDDDDDQVADGQDCDPFDSAVHPGAEETCDAADNDCDGSADEGFPDTDGDGVADCVETDKDGDGVLDQGDNCPAAQNPGQEDADGDGLGDVCDKDADGDGIPDGLDNCAALFNPGQPDTDGDGEGDACDKDDDGDIAPDGQDNCPLLFNPGQEDTDLDGKGNACDDDDDDDGVLDAKDNCPLTPNPGQSDTDKDGAGDACEADKDGDLVPDGDDNCPAVPNPDQGDCDGDGNGNACEDDADADGADDAADNCLCLKNPGQEDQDQDGLGNACDADRDGDGVPNGLDNCADLFNPQQGDLDEDDVGDACDADQDNDGEPNAADNCPAAANPAQTDTDLDGDGDACDLDDDGDGEPDTTDCGPLDPAVSHAAAEQCDGTDNNCALGVDEGFPDADLDGFKDCTDTDDDGDGEPDAADCAPKDPAVHSAAAETCNGVDDNCNGQVDEGFGKVACGLGVCQHTVEKCAGGQLQFCNSYQGSSAEVCDGLDNDCDGPVDEGFGQLQCGLGNCLHEEPACALGQPGQCDPLHGQVPEACDGEDNDCDGLIDDGLGTVTCGLGQCLHTVQSCLDGQVQACDPMAGAAAETCDDKDNDCDGDADDNVGELACGKGECFHVVPVCVDGVPQVCDPLAGQAEEECDGKDNDCDGKTDEELGSTACGLGECLHTVANCAGGAPLSCDPFEGASDEVCNNGKDEDCDGQADDGCSAATCKAWKAANPGLPSAAYTIDPDGEGGNPPFQVWCDMETDGGGWTLLASYTSDLELHIFNPTVHQVQSADNGATVASPPKLWEQGVWGHVAYPWLPVAGRELKLQCRSAPSASWYSYARADLFGDWSNGDKGGYGNGSGWGVLRWQDGRSSHWVCGTHVGSEYPGIAYCQGPGAGGSFGNHIVSISFDPNHGYGGGTAIGCSGTGIDHGKTGQWQGRMWIR